MVKKTYCVFLEKKGIKVECPFGLTPKWIMRNTEKAHQICGLCIKKDYSTSKLIRAKKFVTTVNTL